MYVEGRIDWYMFCEFLCRFVLKADEHEEHDEGLGFCISRFRLIFISAVCMCFGVFRHVLVQVLAADWPTFQLNEMRRLSLAPHSNVHTVWSCSVTFPIIAISFYFHLPHMFMYYFIMHFLIFLSIKKVITQKICIQITWNFLHNDLHDVYYFMDIFPEFVLG